MEKIEHSLKDGNSSTGPALPSLGVRFFRLYRVLPASWRRGSRDQSASLNHNIQHLLGGILGFRVFGNVKVTSKSPDILLIAPPFFKIGPRALPGVFIERLHDLVGGSALKFSKRRVIDKIFP